MFIFRIIKIIIIKNGIVKLKKELKIEKNENSSI